MKLASVNLAISFYIANTVHCSGVSDYEYTENLDFYTLKDGFIAGHFKFQQGINYQSPLDLQDYDFEYFPRPIMEVLESHDLQRLRVSFSRGRWFYDRFGLPPTEPSSMGVQIDALLQKNLSQPLRNSWKQLTATLAGMFCASINQVTERNTIYPQLIEYPGGLLDDASGSPYRYYKALLPDEAVCTENLTPWTKLLPCASSSGLATLLDPRNFFNTSYHLLDVDIKVICIDSECANKSVKLVQNAVFVHRFQGPEFNWKMSEVFGRLVKQICPVARGTKISFQENQHAKPRIWNFENIYVELDTRSFQDGEILNQNFGLGAHLLQESDLPPSYLKVFRRIIGHGHERGSLSIVWSNEHLSKEIELRHLEVFPFFMKTFLSSMEAYLESAPGSNRLDLIKTIRYTPSNGRISSGQLEMAILVPPQSSLYWRVDFDKDFFRLSELPRDALRGIDLNGATISYKSPEDGKLIQMVTGKLLFTIAPPDDSMPYNVIALSCSIIVVFHGMLFNILHRRLYASKEGSQHKLVKLLTKLLTAVRSRIKGRPK